MLYIALWLGTLASADAVPVKLTQQGRLLDSNGVAVDGMHLLAFRIYDNQLAGNLVWEEVLQVNFNNGYYAAILGSDTASNPLEDSVLSANPLFIEMDLNGSGPLGIRKEIVSTPYSRLAGTASSVDGGSVNATEIRVDGQLIVDSNGSWVGPTIVSAWADIQNIPADLADGDDDLLATISCNTGEVLGWNGTQWACAVDNGLTESEVEAFVTNDPIDLHVATTMGGLPILTEGAVGTLSELSCQTGELAKWDSVLMAWGCDVDVDTLLSESDVESFVTNGALDLASGTTMNGSQLLTSDDVLTPDWSNVVNIPVDLADGDQDTQLTDSQVDAYVTNAALDLALGTTMGGLDLLTETAATLENTLCSEGEFLTFVAGSWTCTNLQSLLDVDGDGVFAWNDCNDADSAIGTNVGDEDCDGVLAIDDCNDNDPLSNTVAVDADCDGVLTAVDCDDTNALLLAIANDGDCDGVLTAADCDDSDPLSYAVAQDGDCDGVPTANDCDDSDPAALYPGSSSVCALSSCKDILDQGFSTGDGDYYIDPSGSNAFLVYCDMTTDGGGWTRIGRFHPYSQPNWNTVDYLSSISNSAFPSNPNSSNWMVSYPHANVSHSEALISSDYNSEWIIHNSTDDAWRSSFIGTGGSYPSNINVNVLKSSWGGSQVYYHWCSSYGCTENLHYSNSNCNDLVIPIDDQCVSNSYETFLAIR